MDKSERLIMVVRKDALFGEDFFEGFRDRDEIDYETRILKNFEYIKRKFAENDPNYKQPIAYSMIVNPTLKQVFIYQRATSDAAYYEKRLQGKWAWGVGGHIEKIDVKDGNPIHASMLRELLKEEVEIIGSVKPRVLGYVNSEKDEVSKVHFAILYIIETNATTVKPKDPEIKHGMLRTIEEIDEICSSPDYVVEEWSRISLEPLKLYLYGC